MFFNQKQQELITLSKELRYGVDGENEGLIHFKEPFDVLNPQEEYQSESVSLGYEPSEGGILSSMYEPGD